MTKKCLENNTRKYVSYFGVGKICGSYLKGPQNINYTKTLTNLNLLKIRISVPQ